MSLEALLEEINIPLGRSTDTEVYGLCPGHFERLGREDRRPTSWSVNRDTGLSYCFSCGFSCTLMNLIIQRTDGGMWGALALLEKHGIDPADPSDLPKWSDRNKPIAQRFTHLPESALDDFDLPPLKMLRARNISPETADRYEILWDGRLKAWVFPIRLVGGALLGWQLKMSNRYLNEPDGVPKGQTLFGVTNFEPGTEAVLLESPLDVCRLSDAGVDGGLAAYGVGVSENQMRLILSLTDHLLLALDNDTEGEKRSEIILKGSRRLPAWLPRFGSVRVVRYPEEPYFKDIGEMTDKEIRRAVKRSVEASDWLAR